MTAWVERFIRILTGLSCEGDTHPSVLKEFDDVCKSKGKQVQNILGAEVPTDFETVLKLMQAKQKQQLDKQLGNISNQLPATPAENASINVLEDHLAKCKKVLS